MTAIKDRNNALIWHKIKVVATPDKGFFTRSRTNLILLILSLSGIITSGLLSMKLTGNLSQHAANNLRSATRAHAENGRLQQLGLTLDNMMADEQWRCISVLVQGRHFSGADPLSCKPPAMASFVSLEYGQTEVRAFWVLPKLVTYLLLSFMFQIIIAGALFYRSILHYQSQITALETIKDATTKLAHDIRSPLAALKTAARMLPSHPAQRALVEGCVERISGIANTLLTNYFENPLKEKRERKLFCELRTLLEALQKLSAEKAIEWSVPIGSFKIQDFTRAEKINLVAIKPELIAILSNLINNSMESIAINGKNPEITITGKIEQRQKKFVMTVQDNGAGFSPTYLAQPFAEGNSTKSRVRNSSGNGLGLFHAKKTLSSWGGDLAIDSNQDKGAAVTITLQTC